MEYINHKWDLKVTTLKELKKEERNRKTAEQILNEVENFIKDNKKNTLR